MKKWVYVLLSSMLVSVPPLGYTIGSIIAYDTDSAYDHIIVSEDKHDESVKVLVNVATPSDYTSFEEIAKSDSALGGVSVVLFARQDLVLSGELPLTIDKKLIVDSVKIVKGEYIKIYAGNVEYAPTLKYIVKPSIKAGAPYVSLGLGSLIICLVGGVVIAQIILKKMGWYKAHPRTATFLTLAIGTLILFLINAVVADLLGIFAFALVGWAGYCGLYIYDTRLYPMLETRKAKKKELALAKQKESEEDKKEETESESKGE